MANIALVPTASWQFYSWDTSTPYTNEQHPLVAFGGNAGYILEMPATNIPYQNIKLITVNIAVDASGNGSSGNITFGLAASQTKTYTATKNRTLYLNYTSTTQGFPIPYTPTFSLNQTWYLMIYSDSYDLAGNIITIALTYTEDDKTVSYYDGSSWQKCIPYYYNGSSWQKCVPYYYTGSAWKECSTT